MDPDLINDIQETTPSINERIARGLVSQQMGWAEHYIHLHLQQAAKDFPPQVHYRGIRPCTADELFAYLTGTQKSPKRGVYHSDANSFYLVEVSFEYLGPRAELAPGQGELLCYQFLVPYIESNGLFYMRDKAYSLIPVLVDPGYSYTINRDGPGIFVDVYRIRYNFYRTTKHFMMGSKREPASVVYGDLHHASNQRPKRLPKPALGIYLFSQFGVLESFRLLTNAEVHIGYSELAQADPSLYYVCSALPTKQQNQSPVYIAISREGFNERAKNLIGTFFYYADQYPDRILPEYLDGSADECHLWKVLLGKTLKPEVNSEPTLAKETADHIRSVSKSITHLVTEEFQDRGVMIRDMNDLFVFVIDELGCRTIPKSSEVATLYTKKLVGLKNPLNPITEGIYYSLYSLQRESKERDELSLDQVKKCFHYNFKPRRILEIHNRERGHQEIQLAGSVSDNRYMGLHCSTITQEEVRKRGKGSEGVKLDDPKKFLHASIAEIGSYTNLPKKNPTGRTRINPFVQVDLSGRITRNEEFRELLDKVQRWIET